MKHNKAIDNIRSLGLSNKSDTLLHDSHWMKNYFFLIIAFLLLAGCSKEPTQIQLEIVDRLIQEQIDIPYKETDWNTVKDALLKNGETVKEAEERNKNLYTNIHEFLIALKNKPYKDKKVWAVNMLEIQIELWDASLKALDNPDKELVLLNEQRKEWLAILIE